LANSLRVSKAVVKSLKITLNGFTLDPNDNILLKLAAAAEVIKDNLQVLWIRTANLKNVTLKDFS